MAPLVSYAGVPLAAVSRALCDWAEANLHLADVCDAARPQWPGDARTLWSWPVHPPQKQRVQLGTLCWPTGAARCATYHGLATGDQLKAIRKKVYGTGGTQYLPQAFVMSDGTSKITTSLYLLPPRPLSQLGAKLRPPERDLWLLPLVDARDFWGEVAADIAVTGGGTTWASLFASIASALGITLSPTIDAAYLKPAQVLTSRYQALPLLFDACCYNVGLRLARKLDGTCQVQTPAQAKASQDGQLTKWAKTAGGLFDLATDLDALPPASVLVSFPVTTGGLYTSTQATGSDRTGTKIFRDVATSSGSNNATLNALALQFVTDWTAWQRGRQASAYAGIVPYVPEGLSDRIEWTAREGECSTLVTRGALADPVENLCHHSGAVPGELPPDTPPTLTQRVATSACIARPQTVSGTCDDTALTYGAGRTALTNSTTTFTLGAVTRLRAIVKFHFSFVLSGTPGANPTVIGGFLYVDGVQRDVVASRSIALPATPSGKTVDYECMLLDDFVLDAGSHTIHLEALVGDGNSGNTCTVLGSGVEHLTAYQMSAEVGVAVEEVTLHVPGGTVSDPGCVFDPTDCSCPGSAGSGSGDNFPIIYTPCCPEGVSHSLTAYGVSGSGTVTFTLTYNAALDEWTGTYPGDASCAAAGVQMTCVGNQWVLTGPNGSVTATTQSCSAGSVYIVFDDADSVVPCSGDLTVVIGGVPVTGCCEGVSALPANLLATLDASALTPPCNTLDGVQIPVAYSASDGEWQGSVYVAAFGDTINLAIQYSGLPCDQFTYYLWCGVGTRGTGQHGTLDCTGAGGCPATLQCGSGSCDAQPVSIAVVPGGSGGGGGGITSTALDTKATNSAASLTLNGSGSGVPVMAGEKLLVLVGSVTANPGSVVTFAGVPLVRDALVSNPNGSALLMAGSGLEVFELNVAVDTTGDIVVNQSNGLAVPMVAVAVAVAGLPVNAFAGYTLASGQSPIDPSVAFTPAVAPAFLQGMVFFAAPTGAYAWQAPFTAGQSVSCSDGTHTWTLKESYDAIATADVPYTATLTGGADSGWAILVAGYQ